MENFINSIISFLFLLLTFLPAVILHEIAHGYAAYKLGDPTAKIHGRLTLNPLKHLDPLGTLAIFIIGLGWAKPVPVDSGNFANPKKDDALVSLAGPLTNFSLALLASLAIAFFSFISPEIFNETNKLLQQNLIHPEHVYLSYLLFFLNSFASVNLVLMIFNLIPLPPLDGSHILEYFLPRHLSIRWHDFKKQGPIILLILAGIDRFFNIPIFEWVILNPASYLKTLLLLGLGV